MRTPLPAPTTGPRPLQQTRFQRSLVQVGARLVAWAANPWRRASLQLITLLISFSIGGVVGSISGQIGQIDPVGALLCVLTMELAVRARGPLRRRPGDPLPLQLLDMGRIGLLYGLLLDGFKLL
ncbi:DUF565 domain-containing protein [Cyanobium sp. CH-040]|uniref:DUF565 domain-containing protein n=1 Tax=Cyanobium sp. CH-040 TaxID=2823708 RepID=UPI0020CF84FA|nr:DUF565 domain-containing protein [Cyanobium sp. CH-040]MCP9927335.1 DUF565 domain-containing protein [Cyanobium sp. CH-040]